MRIRSAVVLAMVAACRPNAPVVASESSTPREVAPPPDEKAAAPSRERSADAGAQAFDPDAMARNAGDFDSPPREPIEPSGPPPSDDPATFSRRVDADWSSLACPGTNACLASLDFVAVVAKQGRDHSWTFSYLGKEAPLRAGAVDDAAFGRRFAQGVRHVMAKEQLTVLDASCGFIKYMPEAFGQTEAGIEVTVPKGRRTKVPKTMTPAVAKAVVVTAYERIDYPIDPERPPSFSDADEVARLTGVGLETAHVRMVSAWLGRREAESEALLFAVYSPASAEVRVLDGSYAIRPRARGASAVASPLWPTRRC